MILFLFALAAAAPRSGNAPNAFRNPPACWDGAQNELNECAAKEYRQSDALMSAQWSRTSAVMKRIDRDHPPQSNIGQSSKFGALLAGQQAWLQYRLAHCSIEKSFGGSMAPMLEFICRRDLTRERTKQLKKMMLNPINDEPFY